MHQSIAAVPTPPPPRATAGHLLKLSIPGVRHSQFYRGPGAGHHPTPGICHTCFRINMEEFIGKDEAIVKDWLVGHGLEKLVDVFKGMFSQF